MYLALHALKHVCIPVGLNVCMAVCLYVCMSASLNVCLNACLYVYSFEVRICV